MGERISKRGHSIIELSSVSLPVLPMQSRVADRSYPLWAPGQNRTQVRGLPRSMREIFLLPEDIANRGGLNVVTFQPLSKIPYVTPRTQPTHKE